jgi:hypothetical protein
MMSTTSHADSSIPTAQLPNVQVQPLNQNVVRILTLGSTILPSSPTSVTVNSFLSRNLKGSTHDRPCTSSRSTTECSCPHNPGPSSSTPPPRRTKNVHPYIMQKKASKPKHCFLPAGETRGATAYTKGATRCVGCPWDYGECQRT